MKTNNTNLLYKLSSIRQSAFSFLESEMAKAGITDVPPSFGDILYLIHTQGGAYIKDIADQSYKDKSTVSNIINQLEKKGYVEKRPDPKDGRRVKVHLTQGSEEHIDAMSDISVTFRAKLFENMSNEEQGILFLLLDKIGKNVTS